MKLCYTKHLFIFLVRLDEGAEWFQDHPEDAGGQLALPFVLSFSKLPWRHGARGKSGDNKTYSCRDRAEGLIY